MTGAALLEVHGAVKRFGGLAAVNGASLSIAAGSITALIGPNGAGKTTLFDLITGFTRLDEGTISFSGRRVDRLRPHQIARCGVIRTFQTAKLFRRMHVIDNLLVSTQRQPGERLSGLLARPRLTRTRSNELETEAKDLLALLRLAGVGDDYAGTLSGGQRKLLELGRVLMATPKLIMLDEPLAGVNPALGRELVEHLFALREQRDLTFFLIEHDLRTVMEISDTVIVMSEGKVIAQGSPDAVRSDQRVVDAYLGTSTSTAI